MNTLLTLHLVNIQPVFLFFIFLAVCLVAVSWMLVIKSSRYKELQEGYEESKKGFQESLKDAAKEFQDKKIEWEAAWQEQVNKRITARSLHEEQVRRLTDVNESIRNAYTTLKASLPKPRERDNDGKFVKGSSRLDNLRKHLLEGNRTDRFTAQESFGIAHVGKFISTLKKEGFDIRKEKRKIAKNSFLTEYYLVPEKEVREWNPIEEDGVQTESAMNMGRVLRNAE